MKRLIFSLLLNGIAVFLAAKFLSNVRVDGFTGAIITGLVLTLLNASLKPFLQTIFTPITILTLGLFSLVINAAIILLASWFLDGFYVDGWIAALLFSFVLGILNWLLSWFMPE